MAEIIIVRGMQQHGKTTTIGILYSELLKFCNLNHIFNKIFVCQNSLKYSDTNAEQLIDFTAVLTYKNKTIGLISAGDKSIDTRKFFRYMINEQKVDLIICTARSINREGSVYKMIMNEYSSFHNVILEIFTNYSDKKEDKYSIKDKVVKKIMEIVLK